MLEKFKKSEFVKEIKRLGAEMKPMTFRQRVDHLWTYYKEYLWIVAFLVVFLAAGLSILNYQKYESLVSGMMVNISISQEGYDYLSVDYLEKLGGNPKTQMVELDYANFSSLEDPTSSEDNYNSMLLLVARVEGRLLDYMILDDFAMEYYIIQDVYLDLREFFTPEELGALGDRVITARAEGETDAWAVAVDITDLPFTQDNIRLKNEDDRVYFALSGSTQRLDMCRDAWEYINAWESKSN